MGEVGRICEEMAPDQAADVLAEVEPDRAQRVFELADREFVEEVRACSAITRSRLVS